MSYIFSLVQPVIAVFCIKFADLYIIWCAIPNMMLIYVSNSTEWLLVVLIVYV